MEHRYVQQPEEEHLTWLKRLYEIAHTQAQVGGWMSVDPQLLSILLNNMKDLLPDQQKAGIGHPYRISILNLTVDQQTVEEIVKRELGEGAVVLEWRLEKEIHFIGDGVVESLPQRESLVTLTYVTV